MQPMQRTPQQLAEIARRRQNQPDYQTVAHELPEKHGWRCSPGHQLLVMRRGDLMLEHPAGWVLVPTETSVKLHNYPYPDDTMQYEVSVIRTPVLDMTRLPDMINPLVGICDSIRKDGITRYPQDAIPYDAPGLRARWVDYEKPDTDNGRPTSWRHCFCYPHGKILPYSLIGLITFGYYTEFRDEAEPVWEHTLKTLIMGEQITDPKRGPQRQ